MGSHWIRKIVTVAAIGYFFILLDEGDRSMSFMGLLLVIILGFILIEILLGTVTQAERLMVAGKYAAAGRELKGTLFPRFLLMPYQLKYFSVQTVYLAESGKIDEAKKSLTQSLALGLTGTELTFVLGKLLKGEPNFEEKIEQVMLAIKAIDLEQIDRETLTQKVNELIFNNITL